MNKKEAEQTLEEANSSKIGYHYNKLKAEELINRTLNTIQARWDKKSEEAEEEAGEGIVDFGELLNEVKKALIFIYKKGKASKQKDVLEVINELKTRNINDEGLDVETQEYWINFEEVKKRIEQK